MTLPKKLPVLVAALALGLIVSATSLSGVAGAGSSIMVKDDRFSPSVTTVKKGARVTFMWMGKHPHDVVGSGAASFKSAIQKKGSFSVTLRKKGTVRLICQVHPGMRGTIKVK